MIDCEIYHEVEIAFGKIFSWLILLSVREPTLYVCFALLDGVSIAEQLLANHLYLTPYLAEQSIDVNIVTMVKALAEGA